MSISLATRGYIVNANLQTERTTSTATVSGLVLASSISPTDDSGRVVEDADVANVRDGSTDGAVIAEDDTVVKIKPGC